MRTRAARRRGAGLLAGLLALAPISAASGGDEPLIPPAAWQDPPHALRPVARWWWPGGSVEPVTLGEQLARIEAAGFGAVEVQPLLLGIGAEELAADPGLRTVGSTGFRERVAQAAAHAARRGLAFDLTLGSGWPGGLPTRRENAERQLLMAVRDVEGPTPLRGALPPAPDPSYRRAVEWVLDVLGPPDPETRLVAVLAARPGPERNGVPVLADVRVLVAPGAGDAGEVSVPPGAWRLFAFYENATEHFVMGGAFPGEEADARVVDHLSVAGADALLAGYAAPLLDAIAPGAVREVFVDSFELLGELPFTGDLLEAFAAWTGYSLTPHLPLVFRRGGESKYAEMMDFLGRNGGPRYTSSEPGRAARIREDYEWVRARLFEERFVARFAEWAKERGVALRLQAHGGYADYLDVYARADVPESEGLFAGGSSDFLGLAASAAHVAGRRWASSEAFITMRLLGTRLSEDEMRLLAGRAYAAGINRLAFHGVPYPYARSDGRAWYPFSGGFGRILAGPFPMSSELDDAFLARLPAFNRFLSRLTLAMSRGEPVAEVAWLRADPTFPDRASFQLGRIEPRAGESLTTRALRARGLGHDRVSRRMLAGASAEGGVCRVGAARYRAVLLDPLEVAEPELAEALAAIAEAGVPVLALGGLPQRAPGLRNAEARDARVRAAGQRLARRVVVVPGPEALEAKLAGRVSGTLVEPVAGARLDVSLARRRVASGELLLVFNESWSPRTAELRFTRSGGALTRWDPRTGAREVLRPRLAAGERVPLRLAAAEAVVLTLDAR